MLITNKKLEDAVGVSLRHSNHKDFLKWETKSRAKKEHTDKLYTKIKTVCL